MSEAKEFIAYYRVSTKRQERSGLSLEAQSRCVEDYVKGKGVLVGEYREVESGKVDSRPELAKAISESKRRGATLICAKIDRLSRSVSMLFRLRDEGIDFVCCDLPELSTVSLGVFAAFVQHEREEISRRTTLALRAKKARGAKLGPPKSTMTKETQIKGAAANRAKAIENRSNQVATELAKLYRERGLSLRRIAEELNHNGHVTPKGNEWTGKGILRLLQRAKETEVKSTKKG